VNPWLAIGLVAAGWVVFTRPALIFGGPVGLSGCQPLSEETAARLIATGQYPSAGQAAAGGAAAGAALAGATFGISIGVGAAAGYFVRKSGNDTKKDRESFAARLGFPSLDALYQGLDRLGRHDLSNMGLNVIGRKDHDGNAKWQRDVLIAMIEAGFCL